MISVLKRRASRTSRKARVDVAGDPAARFAYELATKPPTKDVAAVKAATELFEANRQGCGTDEPPQADDRSIDKTY